MVNCGYGRTNLVRRLMIDRVLVLMNPRLIQTRGGGGDSASVECFFSITPRSYRRAEKVQEIQRRWSTCSQYTPCHAGGCPLDAGVIGGGGSAAVLTRLIGVAVGVRHGRSVVVQLEIESEI